MLPPAVPRQTAPATPETIEVQVPPGAVPGATIEFELDDGRVIDVPVPEGARAGDRLQVPLSLATAAPPAESIEIQVPEGAVPGATLEFTLDDGRTIDITVPDGARAGDRLQVPVPPLSPSAGPDAADDWDEGPDDLDEIEEME